MHVTEALFGPALFLDFRPVVCSAARLDSRAVALASTAHGEPLAPRKYLSPGDPALRSDWLWHKQRFGRKKSATPDCYGHSVGCLPRCTLEHHGPSDINGDRFLESKCELVRECRRWRKCHAGNDQRFRSYRAPSAIPAAGRVTIKAVSAADSSATATTTLTLWNPSPTLGSLSPQSFATGAFTLTINGGSYVNGAQVLFAGAALSTTFVSATKLTATGSAPTTGTFSVAVQNPNPGASQSNSVNVQVTSNIPPPPPSACSVMAPGQGGSLNSFVPFPADSLWNKDISSAPVDPNSTALINFIGASVTIHPDFGSGLYQGSSIGIPYVVVDSTQPFVPINFTAYGDESDPGPMPVPANAPIEGYPNPGNDDRHVLVLDNNNCWLYELYSASPGAGGAWNAASAAVWDLQNDEQRP
jgi:hypothetical protein